MSETFDSRLDGERLGKQLGQVCKFMLWAADQGEWATLQDIHRLIGYPEASISARLRDLRRMGYLVEKRRRGNPKAGLFEYRVTKPVLQQQRLAFSIATATRDSA